MNLDKQNSRKHSDRNKAAIRKSLETAKAARSIVIDSGDNVLAGNGVAEQWEAMGGKVRVVETSGDELVAVKRVDVAPDSPQARQIATLDNLVADTSAFDYDAERLREALANDPVSKAIAEQDERLRKLLKVTKPESVDAGELVDKAAQLQEKWQVKRGDLWQCGKHRILCGDSTNAEDVARLMQGEKADLGFTSPPYNVDIKYAGYKDNKEKNDYKDLICAVVARCYEALADGRYLAWNVGVSRRTFHLEHPIWIMSEGLDFDREIVWQKVGVPWPLFNTTRRNALARNYHPNYQHEMIYLFTKGKPEYGTAIELDEKYQNDVWLIQQSLAIADLDKEGERAEGMKEGSKYHKVASHPAAFPPALPVAIIQYLSSPNEFVYDPFLGSGTTLIAAEQTGRIGRGVEIEPKYVAVSLERLANLGLTCERISQT